MTLPTHCHAAVFGVQGAFRVHRLVFCVAFISLPLTTSCSKVILSQSVCFCLNWSILLFSCLLSSCENISSAIMKRRPYGSRMEQRCARHLVAERGVAIFCLKLVIIHVRQDHNGRSALGILSWTHDAVWRPTLGTELNMN